MAKINTYQRELYHHGILGQKWGRKMGPPYPLGSGDHSATEKKEGWKKSLGGGRNESLYERGQKRAQKSSSELHSKDSNSYKKRADKKEEKLRNKLNKIEDKKEKVRDYNEAYDRASELSDKSDEMFKKAKEIHKSLAKTPIGRAREVYKVQIGKGSEAAKEYSRLYDEASDFSDKAFDAWVEADKKYAKLGKTYASRVINAAKYDSRNNTGNNVDKYIWDTRKKRR